MGRGGCICSCWGIRGESVQWGNLGVGEWIILEVSAGRSGFIMVRWLYRVLLGKPEGKKPLGRPRRRWVDNIRMGLCGECGV